MYIAVIQASRDATERATEFDTYRLSLKITSAVSHAAALEMKHQVERVINDKSNA